MSCSGSGALLTVIPCALPWEVEQSPVIVNTRRAVKKWKKSALLYFSHKPLKRKGPLSKEGSDRHAVATIALERSCRVDRSGSMPQGWHDSG